MGVVAVGVDGSDRSVPALEWAANEAAAHGHTLRVVTAWSIPVTALSPGGLPAPYTIGELESDARAAQDAVIAKADMPEGLVVEHHVVEGGGQRRQQPGRLGGAHVVLRLGESGGGGADGLLHCSHAVQVDLARLGGELPVGRRGGGG